jgi:hypothetical protein
MNYTSVKQTQKKLMPYTKTMAVTARWNKVSREDVVAELILMVNPLFCIMSVPMLNYDWYLALRSVLSTSWVWPK